MKLTNGENNLRKTVKTGEYPIGSASKLDTYEGPMIVLRSPVIDEPTIELILRPSDLRVITRLLGLECSSLEDA